MIRSDAEGGLKEYKHLSFASSLCGACTETCPVKINLHELLLYNRNDSVKEGMVARSEKTVMWAYKTAMRKRKNLDMLSSQTKNMMLNKFFAASWGDKRNMPSIAPKSFKDLWEERKEEKKK